MAFWYYRGVQTVLVVVFMLLSCQMSLAAQVNFSWLPNSENNISGYRIHYGVASRRYTKVVDVGSPAIVDGRVKATVFQLTDGQTWFFAVTAYDNLGNESSYSNEIVHTTDGVLDSGGGVVLDNGDTGTTGSGTWASSDGLNPYGTSSLYSRMAGAEYIYETTVSGAAQIDLWWTQWASRCSNVPVEIYNGNILLDTVYVDQLQNGGSWNMLGEYDFTSTGRVVIRSDSSICSTSADAVKFTVTEVPVEPESIVDNGDAGTSGIGTWIISGGLDPYETKSLYSKMTGAKYSYETAALGLSQVSLWWTQWASRCSSVPVEIYNGNILLDTVYVDQLQNGGVWNMVGEYNFTGMGRVVIRSDDSFCSTSADAVKFTKVY